MNFDGTGISVFDLKKEIILANNLGKANDFDLCIYDNSSNEGASIKSRCHMRSLKALVELKDDSHIIPRSSSVVVKRVFAKPGKGKAAMYIAGTSSAGASAATSEPSKSQAGANGSYSSWHRGNMSKRFDGKEDAPTGPKATTSAPVSRCRHHCGLNFTSRNRLRSQAQSPEMTRPKPWPPCSKPRLRIGRKRKIRCLSWCRAQRFLFHVVHIVLMNIVSVSFSDRKSTRLNSSHSGESRMPSSA